MRTTLVATCSVAGLALAAALSSADAPRTGYAKVNGLDLYYEIHGTGEPLILLHGGIGAIDMFGEVLPMLSKGRRVIGVDLQAHGRTADIDRPMTFEAMAGDVAALLEHLGIAKADVMATRSAPASPCARPSSTLST